MECVFIVGMELTRAQQVAKEVRTAGVLSEIVAVKALAEGIEVREPKGIIAGDGLPDGVGLDQIPLWRLDEVPFSPAQLESFLTECGCGRTWNMENYLEVALQQVRRQVGSGRAICGLSGGVDSAVAAALVHKAIGSNLTCIYVDHGLMRAGESEQVVRVFRQELGIPLVHVQAQDRFLAKLAGIEDPEEKRKIIGTEFIRVFEEEAARIGDAAYLVQGTLYPDVIESGAQESGVFIKSHHNVGGLPEQLNLELVEPLDILFKDEVRVLAQTLGLPDEITWRHPFPGPGLAIRIIGEVTREKLEILRQADAIAMEEINRAGLYREIWQAAVILTNMRTVGVYQGERTYEYVAALRCVNSTDGMEADWSRVPPEVLARISRRVLAEVRGINRLVYDISAKPPATIEWE
ncbi:MAG: glutamine-hydrolyzing GMP synthase [Bacillota bacterium]|nr:glutamine-hydrolyzing GMP synthase [Bacillota bacterium]